MDRYIEDYEFSFDEQLNERSRANTLRFCKEWKNMIYMITGEDINRAFWEDVPVLARFTYLKVYGIKSEYPIYSGNDPRSRVRVRNEASKPCACDVRCCASQ